MLKGKRPALDCGQRAGHRVGGSIIRAAAQGGIDEAAEEIAGGDPSASCERVERIAGVVVESNVHLAHRCSYADSRSYSSIASYSSSSSADS